MIKNNIQGIFVGFFIVLSLIISSESLIAGEKKYFKKTSSNTWNTKINSEKKASFTISSGCYDIMRGKYLGHYTPSKNLLEIALQKINPFESLNLYMKIGYNKVLCHKPTLWFHTFKGQKGQYHVSKIDDKNVLLQNYKSYYYSDLEMQILNYRQVIEALKKQDLNIYYDKYALTNLNQIVLSNSEYNEILTAVSTDKEDVQKSVDRFNKGYLKSILKILGFWFSIIIVIPLILILIYKKLKPKLYRKFLKQSSEITKSMKKNNRSISEELLRWSDLKDKGVITEEELDNIKKELLTKDDNRT